MEEGWLRTSEIGDSIEAAAPSTGVASPSVTLPLDPEREWVPGREAEPELGRPLPPALPGPEPAAAASTAGAGPAA